MDLGKQFENVQPMPKQKSITFGDTYNENGKRTYLKIPEEVKQ